MHRRVARVGDPGLLVHHRQSPGRYPRRRDMIEPRDRDVVDVEGQATIRLTTEREAYRRADRAAMADRDDVLACFLRSDPHDLTADAGVEIHKTLAAGRALVDVGKP